MNYMNKSLGKVERYIYERLDEKGALMFMVVDPICTISAPAFIVSLRFSSFIIPPATMYGTSMVLLPCVSS